MFGSLRVRNYRLYAGGQVVSLIGTWMQRIAQDWLVLTLSHGDPLALGVVAALQFTPMLLSPWAGVLADRYDKRRLLAGIQAGLGVCALALGLLDVTGLVALWHVYLLAAVLGAFSAMDSPVRQAFAVEMVGREALPNAVALNSMTFTTARIIGPAVAGIMIAAAGTGWVFLVNAASFLTVITGLLVMDPTQLHAPARVARAPGQLREGLRYVRHRPDLVLVLVLVFCVSTFGLNFYLTLALLARNVFGRGAESYGLLSTLMAVGSLAGATLAARRVGPPRMRLVIGAAAVFGVCTSLVGLMPTYLATGLMLVPTGMAALTFTTAANSAVQLSVSPSMRGRVMGLYMLVFLGGNPVGGPVLGWIAGRYGGRAPVLLGGVVALASVLGCAAVLAWRSKLRPRVHSRPVPHVQLSGPTAPAPSLVEPEVRGQVSEAVEVVQRQAR